MKSGFAQSFTGDLEALYRAGAVGGMTDRELLGHFTTTENPVGRRAFEAIVSRHGSMVLSVCRRVLRDEHAAEDAFQATFLTLALKAAAIHNRDSLGPWLHGVATRISQRARSISRRHAAHALKAPDRAFARPPRASSTTPSYGPCSTKRSTAFETPIAS